MSVNAGLRQLTSGLLVKRPMIAFNGDEIGGLPSTQDLPVRRSGRPDARTRGNGLFASGDTKTLCAIARGLHRRDPDLLDRLIEQYQHRLLRYLVSLTADRAVAEDLFQETWMRVLERGHQYDHRHEFSALAVHDSKPVCTSVIIWQAWTWSEVEASLSRDQVL
jgi:hypothetical protein